jgi:hypothetical protein
MGRAFQFKDKMLKMNVMNMMSPSLLEMMIEDLMANPGVSLK